MFGLSTSQKDRVFYDAFEKHVTCVVRARELLLQAPRRGVAGRIVWASVLTVPGAAIISAVSFWAAVKLGFER